MDYIEYMDYLDYTLKRLSEKFREGLILSDLRYDYKKITGIWIDSETQAHFEALYEYKYFVRYGTTYKHKILPEIKSIIDKYGALSAYLKETEIESYNKNHFLSENDLASPIIHTTNNIIDKTPSRSWIELASWVIGSIASMILIYEFIIKQLFDNK